MCIEDLYRVLDDDTNLIIEQTEGENPYFPFRM